MYRDFDGTICEPSLSSFTIRPSWVRFGHVNLRRSFHTGEETANRELYLDQVDQDVENPH